jgi:tRNA(fMet)-specific endonuclease VapC
LNYLLDTNACIALINQTSVAVRNHSQNALSHGGQICVSSVVTFELWYGIAKSVRQDENMQRLETFLAGPIILLPFDDEDARVAGSIRATLQASGMALTTF